MPKPFDTVSVLGAGAWGTALAQVATAAGRKVLIWARETLVVESPEARECAGVLGRLEIGLDRGVAVFAGRAGGGVAWVRARGLTRGRCPRGQVGGGRLGGQVGGGRLGGQVGGGMRDATAYVEAEVDVNDTQRKIAAIGGDYKLGNAGRLYARHEFISSLTGPYGLNSQQRHNATVVGLNTEYMRDASLFSEYRVRDAISGGDAEAAVGLRNLWTLSEGLRLQTGFERVHSIAGSGNGESTALTFGLDYTANPIWKGSARVDLRDGKSNDSILATVAAAAKLAKDRTLLARNTYSLIKNKGSLTGEAEQERSHRR